MLLVTTIREIQVSEEWAHLPIKPFPKLPEISEAEMETLVSALSTGKAIALDEVTDSLFRKERFIWTESERKNPPKCLYKSTVKKLRNMWRAELDNFLSGEDTWAGRLIPLNKVSPSIPNRFQMRPILVQSPIVKLLEARFLAKLQEYLRSKLHPSQTGFVPGFDIQTNLVIAFLMNCYSRN